MSTDNSEKDHLLNKFEKENKSLKKSLNKLVLENGDIMKKLNDCKMQLHDTKHKLNFEMLFWQNIENLSTNYMDENNISWMDDTFEIKLYNSIIEFLKNQYKKKRENEYNVTTNLQQQ